jgi:cytochrome c553
MAQMLRDGWVELPARLLRVNVATLVLAVVYGTALAAEQPAPQYVNTITALQETAGGQTIANIMPAAPVIVRANQESYVQVEMTGWSPAGGAKYLFKDIGLRINLALLTEDGVKQRVVVGTKDDDWGSTWEDVKITGWIEQTNLVQDVDTIWQEAGALYYTRCSRCHSLRRPQEFTANQWPSILKIMSKRSGFSPEQTALVTILLQNHGKGQEVKDSFTQTAAAPTPAEPAAIPEIVGTPELAEKGAGLFQSAGCAACHGEDAKTPIMPEYPKLAGQNAEYLFKQILDFQKGIRTNDAYSAMKEAVAPLSEDDARAIAYWLSTQ